MGVRKAILRYIFSQLWGPHWAELTDNCVISNKDAETYTLKSVVRYSSGVTDAMRGVLGFATDSGAML